MSRRPSRSKSGFVRLCLPRPAQQPPSGPDWVHEIKHDGFRILARRDERGAKLREAYLPFVQAIVPLLLEIEEADREIRLVNHEAPYKATYAGGYLLDSVEHAARGPSALQLRHLQIMKDLRLPNWEGGELPVWPPHRPMILTGLTPAMLGDPRLSTGDWWQQAQAAAERE